MSWINNQLVELTWEKGQLSTNGLGSSSPSPKPIWACKTSNDTLESIVHQATSLKPPPSLPPPPPPPAASATVKSTTDIESTPCRKRSRSDSNVEKKSSRILDFGTLNNNHIYEADGGGGCAAVGESDGTVMTWPLPASFPTSNKDLACRARSEVNDEEEEESNKTETTSTKSLSSANTRTRTAKVHNLSERRRRERINQKMKALQKLVPNAHKTDKASMLDEVIDYLKQLQAQVEMMSQARSMVAPQMIIPIDALHHHHHQHKQQLQMSLLAATMGGGGGVGLGMGMVPSMHIINPLAAPQFLHHQAAHINNSNNCQTNNGRTSSSSMLSFDALAQSKNMELYMGKLAAIYQQQLHHHHNNMVHAINGVSQQSDRP